MEFTSFIKFKNLLIKNFPNLFLDFNAIIFGFISFIVVTGGKIINPKNINWLTNAPNSDPITAYLGWEYFRTSSWTVPLGKNPDYGLLNSNSIVYSDSIPLFAIPLKFLSPVISTNFQYFLQKVKQNS